jgi:haloalkane dehalogenase
MDVYRTPDEQFEGLPGYDFAPHYAEVLNDDGSAPLRVHYLDEGPLDAPPVLLMHGEPSWSYLYRKMVPVLRDAGLRCIAPDLVGFGRSDKPLERTDYTYQRHVDWMTSLVEQLDLRDATFVGQDWGGLIGLRLVTAMPDRFARIVAANTYLPTGDRPANEAFMNWQRFSQTVPEFGVGFIVSTGCASELPAAVVAAYDAPYPEERAKAGARQFPMLVPTSPDDPAAGANRAAWDVLRAWKKPFLTAFSDQDPITRGADRAFQRDVPGCAGQPHTTIEGGGHFLQEDKGEDLAKVVVEFVGATA